MRRLPWWHNKALRWQDNSDVQAWIALTMAALLVLAYLAALVAVLAAIVFVAVELARSW